MDTNDDLRELITMMVAWLKSMRPGSEFACNSYMLLGRSVDYAVWVEATKRLQEVGVLTCQRVSNGYGGWDYAYFLDDPCGLDLVSI